MKRLLATSALVVPAAFGAYLAFHPGVAYAEPGFLQAPVIDLSKGAYSSDAMHTSIGFEINHMGLSNIHGRFTKHSGRLTVDPKNIANSSVEFTIQTESVDTAVAPRDVHLRTADFFDAAKYPTMVFRSSSIEKRGNGYVARGTLTIKNVTKTISIPFKVHGPVLDPMGTTRIGVIADPIKINRQDYGIAYNDKLSNGASAIGNDVTIRLAMEATKDKAK